MRGGGRGLKPSMPHRCLYYVCTASHFCACRVVGLWICIALSSVPQKLLEFRYFILPYLFARGGSHCGLMQHIRIVCECDAVMTEYPSCLCVWVFVNVQEVNLLYNDDGTIAIVHVTLPG